MMPIAEVSRQGEQQHTGKTRQNQQQQESHVHAGLARIVRSPVPRGFEPERTQRSNEQAHAPTEPSRTGTLRNG